MRRTILAFVATFAITANIALLDNCAPRTVVNLSPAAEAESRADVVVKLINDVTTGAILANKAGRLPDAMERVLLTINKEILDVIASHPTTWKALVFTTFVNAVQPLPPATQAALNPYLKELSGILARIE